MNRFIIAGVLLLLPVAAGCGGSDGASFADAEWRLRCPASGEGLCTANGPAREIVAEEGDPGFLVECSTHDAGEGLTLFRMRIGVEEDGGGRAMLVLDDLVFDEGYDISGGSVQVREYGESSPFVGTLGDDCEMPSFARVETDHGPAYAGEVRCTGMAPDATPTRQRDLTSPDSASEPAAFSISRCD
ncbi:MAG: hypothetical protein ACODAU_01505 [Myxococcota bacterium]